MNAKSVVLFLILIISAASVFALPTLSPIGAKTVAEGVLLTFNVTISEVNDSFTNFTNTSISLPMGAELKKFNGNIATYRFTPNYTQSGTYNVLFLVNATNVPTLSESVAITVTDVPASMSVGTLVFGGTSQGRSNPQSNDEVDENLLVSSSVTVTNTGSEPITGLNVTSIIPSGYDASTVNITLTSLSATSLSSTQSSTLSFSGRIPKDLDAVNNNLDPSSVTVATVTIRGTTGTGGTITGTIPVTMQAKNQLRIKDVRITIDGKSENVDDGDNVDGARPGAHVKLEVEVENRYNTNDKVSLEDVEVRVESDDLDIDEEDDLGDISPKKEKTSVLEFDIDDDADDDSFEVEIFAEAEDENGARMGERLRFDIEVERNDNEIMISTFGMEPESVSCEAESNLNIIIRNTGQNDEDKVYVRIASPDLFYGRVAGPYNLDEDSSTSLTFNVPLPANLTTGTKRVTVETFYDGDQLSDREVALLRVQKCGSTTSPVSTSQPPTQNKPPVEVVDTPRQPTTQPPVVATTPPAQTTGFTSSPYYIPALVLANVVILIAAVFLVAKLMASGK